MKNILLKHGSTIILRLSVFAIGLFIFALCVGIAFLIADGEQDYRTPMWLGLYVAAVPFYIALYQTFKLLSYIDKNKAFSMLSVKALNTIKYCGFAIAGWFALSSPYTMHVAQKDDAPGIFAIALVLIGASFAVGIFAAVLQKLLKDAIAIKKENDLTV